VKYFFPSFLVLFNFNAQNKISVLKASAPHGSLRNANYMIHPRSTESDPAV
jgi:hypothetical protein